MLHLVAGVDGLAPRVEERHGAVHRHAQAVALPLVLQELQLNIDRVGPRQSISMNAGSNRSINQSTNQTMHMALNSLRQPNRPTNHTHRHHGRVDAPPFPILHRHILRPAPRQRLHHGLLCRGVHSDGCGRESPASTLLLARWGHWGYRGSRVCMVSEDAAQGQGAAAVHFKESIDAARDSPLRLVGTKKAVTTVGSRRRTRRSAALVEGAMAAAAGRALTRVLDTGNEYPGMMNGWMPLLPAGVCLEKEGDGRVSAATRQLHLLDSASVRSMAKAVAGSTGSGVVVFWARLGFDQLLWLKRIR